MQYSNNNKNNKHLIIPWLYSYWSVYLVLTVPGQSRLDKKPSKRYSWGLHFGLQTSPGIVLDHNKRAGVAGQGTGSLTVVKVVVKLLLLRKFQIPQNNGGGGTWKFNIPQILDKNLSTQQLGRKSRRTRSNCRAAPQYKNMPSTDD